MEQGCEGKIIPLSDEGGGGDDGGGVVVEGVRPILRQNNAIILNETKTPFLHQENKLSYPSKHSGVSKSQMKGITSNH